MSYQIESFSLPQQQPTHVHPDQVLADRSLNTAEKRAILANWMSDARAVPDKPTLRRLDNGATVPAAEIMSALKRIDGATPSRFLPFASRYRSKLMGEAIRVRRRHDGNDDDPPPAPIAARPPGLHGSTAARKRR